MRDEYRTDYDEGRGGFGNIVKQELASRQEQVAQQMGMYSEGQDLDDEADGVAEAPEMKDESLQAMED